MTTGRKVKVVGGEDMIYSMLATPFYSRGKRGGDDHWRGRLRREVKLPSLASDWQMECPPTQCLTTSKYGGLRAQFEAPSINSDDQGWYGDSVFFFFEQRKAPTGANSFSSTS